MRHALRLLPLLLTFSTLNTASRFAPAQRSRLGLRQICPPKWSSQTINGKSTCIPPCPAGDTAVIFDGSPQCANPPPSCTDDETAAIANGIPGCVPLQPSKTSALPTAALAAAALESSQNSQGISAGTVVPANPDPCGPPTGQAPGAAGGLSTCHKNVSVADLGQPSYYGVQCTNDDSGYMLEQSTCSDALFTMCYQISGEFGSQYQRTDTWIWSTQNGNCTFGYWLPKGGAPPPSFERCQEQITSVINQYCPGPVFNAGGVNLKIFPAAGASNSSSTGLPVDSMYPSYVMLPSKSHCGINAMDRC